MPPADPVVVTPAALRRWPLPEPGDDGDKHDRGTVLVVGGATSTPGAVLLAGLAALRAGAGRLQLLTTSTTSVPLAVALPEAMVVGVEPAGNGSLDRAAAEEAAQRSEGSRAVLVGPGLLGRDETGALVAALLPRLGDDTCVVLDAAAISAVGSRPELVAPLAGRLVLTPNAGELAALLDDDGLSGLDAARAAAERYGAVVATQGCVAAPDGRAWSEGAGGAGLGTSGSGDVLAGLVAGLLARGADPAQAAVWGQHVHATAGDRLAARVGRLGFLARELLEEVAPVLATCRG